MIYPSAKLNPKIFDKDVEQKPTRNGYGDGLVEAGEKDKNVVALSADLTESTRAEAFAKKFPDRFFEVGVAEQNLATIAAGLGVSGKIPFISSYAAFSPGRNWEQIRTTVAYNNSNVKVAGHHAGISVGPDGVTHQAIEDIATMRVIANMRVIVPCDAIEAKKATMAAAHIMGPFYLRFSREKSPIITTEDTPFHPGKAQVMWQSKGGRTRLVKQKVAILAAGPLVYEALLAAQDLEKEGVEVVVLNVHTVKPLDEQKILEVAKKYGAIITVEEHQVLGGLGGAIAELTARKQPVPIEFIGLQGIFAESGPAKELFKKYGMTAKDIKVAAKKVMRRRN